MITNMTRRPSILKKSSAIKSYSASLSMPKHSYLLSSYSYGNKISDIQDGNISGLIMLGHS